MIAKPLARRDELRALGENETITRVFSLVWKTTAKKKKNSRHATSVLVITLELDT